MAPVVERRKKIQFMKGNVYEGKPFTGLRWVEDKFDGLRGGIDVTAGTAVTLTGLPIPNAQHIIDELSNCNGFENMFLDGEFKGRDWNESQSIVKTQKPHPDAMNLKFYLFDMLPFAHWDAKKSDLMLHKRKSDLDYRLSLHLLPHIVRVPHKIVHTHEEIIAARNEAVSRGLEGVMIKNPLAVYGFKKNNDWLKCKPINEDDFEITGATVGRGEKAGMLGALLIKATINNVEVVSEVGTGFDDLTRKKLWANYLNGRLLGRIVQCEYQEVTEDGALRFPVFMRMRDDKTLT